MDSIFLVCVETRFCGDKQFKVFPKVDKASAMDKASKIFQSLKQMEKFTAKGKFTKIEKKPNSFFASDDDVNEYIQVKVCKRKL